MKEIYETRTARRLGEPGMSIKLLNAADDTEEEHPDFAEGLRKMADELKEGEEFVEVTTWSYYSMEDYVTEYGEGFVKKYVGGVE